MGFFRKMFGKQDPVQEIEQLHTARDWAGVLAVARRLDFESLDDTTQTAITDAGDKLAELNLEEGAYALQTGSILKAKEHYQLALELVHSTTLRQRVEQSMAELQQGAAAPGEMPGAKDHAAGCGSGCGPTCAPSDVPAEQATDGLDEESRLELLLATCPPELAERYAGAGPLFRKAWLAAQDGLDDQAQSLLEQIPQNDRDALFHLEMGALLLRQGQPAAAKQSLQTALQAEPDLLPAFDTLVGLLAQSGETAELMQRLKQNITDDRFVGYCWARLAEVHARRAELEPALTAGLKALDEGVQDPGVTVLCAQLLEQHERYDEAEALLRRLPAGGCGGGAHPLLAECWLRQGKNLNQALESFKGALRQERDNPRWMLRIAQTYLAKGWRKEASGQLEALLARHDLPEELRTEVLGTAEQMNI